LAEESQSRQRVSIGKLVSKASSFDYGFIPRSHAYNFRTLDESYSELKKKTRQLENYLDDVDWRDDHKVSRVSWRNKAEMNEKKREEEVNNIESFITRLAWFNVQADVILNLCRKREQTCEAQA